MDDIKQLKAENKLLKKRYHHIERLLIETRDKNRRLSIRLSNIKVERKNLEEENEILKERLKLR